MGTSYLSSFLWLVPVHGPARNALELTFAIDGHYPVDLAGNTGLFPGPVLERTE